MCATWISTCTRRRKSSSGRFVAAALLLLGGPTESFCHTFSIVAWDPETKAFGVAVSTLPDAVGTLVPWARFGVGAVATQARVNAGFGPRGLKLLEEGRSADEALQELLRDDELKEQRQLAIVDAAGRVAAHTGSKCMDWAGHRPGKHFSVQGNILVSEKTVEAMKAAFEKEGHFVERLMAALEAGRAAGGDKRGHHSAALLVVHSDAERWYGKGYDRLVDLRVDHHDEPVAELRRLLSRKLGEKPKAGPRVLRQPEGDDVAELSRLLARRGYLTGEPPRVFTDRVADAVRAFKRDAGLGAGDTVDAAVLAALARAEPLRAAAAGGEITPPFEPWEDANGDGRHNKDEKYTDTNGNGRFDYVWLAGFSPGRHATAVHDPLTAQALVVAQGKQTAAVVVLDIIGLLYRDVGEIRKLASAKTGIPEANIIVASTHNHNSSDTLGLWGGLPTMSGRDPAYLASMKEKAAAVVAEAHAKLTPVKVRWASAEIKGLCGDSRKPVIMNEVGRALLFEGADGKAVASFVNYGCHPEARGSRNTEITSDYPNWVREEMRTRFGGAPCVFTVGDIGGLIAPRVGRKWEDAERMGRTIAGRLAEELAKAPAEPVEAFKIASRKVRFPLDNVMFQRAAKAGNFGNPEGYIEEGHIPSELTALRLGPVVLFSSPGEIFPELGAELYDAVESPRKIMIGLGNDELGYIMPETSWTPGEYCESMSVGAKTGTILATETRALLKGF